MFQLNLMARACVVVDLQSRWPSVIAIERTHSIPPMALKILPITIAPSPNNGWWWLRDTVDPMSAKARPPTSKVHPNNMIPTMPRILAKALRILRKILKVSDRTLDFLDDASITSSCVVGVGLVSW